MQVKSTSNGGYIIDGALFVPPDPANADHRRVQDWIAAGNTPEPAPTEPTLSEVQRQAARHLVLAGNDPVSQVLRATIKQLGASLREVRGVSGLTVRSDSEFVADVLAAIDAGEGEV